MTETIIYHGKVTKLNNDISFVSLVDQSNGKLTNDVPGDTHRLLAAKLQLNDEFEIIIQKDEKSSKNIIRKIKIQPQLELNL